MRGKTSPPMVYREEEEEQKHVAIELCFEIVAGSIDILNWLQRHGNCVSYYKLNRIDN